MVCTLATVLLSALFVRLSLSSNIASDEAEFVEAEWAQLLEYRCLRCEDLEKRNKVSTKTLHVQALCAKSVEEEQRVHVCMQAAEACAYTHV